MKRFHRGGKEWRLYSWKEHIVYHAGPGEPYYEIKPLLNAKNSKRRNRKNNRKLQSIIAKKGSRLFRALKILSDTRGDITCDALFPQPFDHWRVDPVTGKRVGFKNVPIGHNSFQMVYDQLLSRTLLFNNVYWMWNKERTKKVKKRYYSLYGLRPSLITAAATGGMHNDAIMNLSQHSSTTEIETYMRDSQQTQRTQRAQNQFKQYVMNRMYCIQFC